MNSEQVRLLVECEAIFSDRLVVSALLSKGFRQYLMDSVGLRAEGGDVLKGFRWKLQVGLTETIADQTPNLSPFLFGFGKVVLLGRCRCSRGVCCNFFPASLLRLA